jgi:hypothetical protein
LPIFSWEGTLVTWRRTGEAGSGWQEEFTSPARAFPADGGELGNLAGEKMAPTALPGSLTRHGDLR